MQYGNGVYLITYYLQNYYTKQYNKSVPISKIGIKNKQLNENVI